METVTDYSQYLKRGKDNARSRAAGQVIISSTSGGYYLPADRADIIEFINSMEARAKNIMAAIRSARKAIRNPEGQITLDDLPNV